MICPEGLRTIRSLHLLPCIDALHCGVMIERDIIGTLDAWRVALSLGCSGSVGSLGRGLRR